jgi:sec-independent protein translocase protein TatB
MFDIGFWEILLIGVVALIVIGPERLPSAARTVGRWVAKVQRFVSGVKSDLHSELETGELRKLLGDQESQIRELKDLVHEARDGFEKGTKEASSLAQKSIAEAKTALETSEQGATAATTSEPNNSTESDISNERVS